MRGLLREVYTKDGVVGFKICFIIDANRKWQTLAVKPIDQPIDLAA
jgi:hypothetical protein